MVYELLQERSALVKRLMAALGDLPAGRRMEIVTSWMCLDALRELVAAQELERAEIDLRHAAARRRARALRVATAPPVANPEREAALKAQAELALLRRLEGLARNPGVTP